MSANRRHHYVPQFHLREFSVDGRSISLLHLKSGNRIAGAPIKSQAYKNNYYGSVGAEQAIGAIEGAAAKLFRTVAQDRYSLSTDEYLQFFTFYAVQKGRTISSEAEIVQSGRDFSELMKSGGRVGLEPHWEAALLENVVGLSMTTHLSGAPVLFDLKGVLLRNRTRTPFITCDSPALSWNPAWKAIRGRGGFGMASVGLIVGMPLSPHLFFLAYDRIAYTLPGIGSTAFDVQSANDIRRLNLLVAMSAKDNLYFDPSATDVDLEYYRSQSEKFRIGPKTRSVELFQTRPGVYKALSVGEQIPDEGESVVVTSRVGIELPLGLSFLHQRRPIRFQDDGSGGGQIRDRAWSILVEEHGELARAGVRAVNVIEFAAQHRLRGDLGGWFEAAFGHP